MADKEFSAVSSVRKTNDDVSIKDVIKVFIPKLWIIAICAIVLSVVLSGYAIVFKDNTYTSKTTFIVSTTSGGITDGDLKLSYKVIDVLQVHILSEDFLEQVADTINSRYEWKVTAKELKRSIKVEKNNEDAPAFTLSITTGDAIKSHDIAETLRDYMIVDSKDDKYFIQDFMNSAYSKVTMTCVDTPTLGVMNDKGVLMKGVVGFLAGAVVSMVVIYMLAMFDVIIHDRKKLEDTFNLPILGVIPRYEVAAENEAKGGAGK